MPLSTTMNYSNTSTRISSKKAYIWRPVRKKKTSPESSLKATSKENARKKSNSEVAPK